MPLEMLAAYVSRARLRTGQRAGPRSAVIRQLARHPCGGQLGRNGRRAGTSCQQRAHTFLIPR